MLLDEERVAFGVERGGEFVAEREEEAFVFAENRRDGFESAGRLEVHAGAAVVAAAFEGTAAAGGLGRLVALEESLAAGLVESVRD